MNEWNCYIIIRVNLTRISGFKKTRVLKKTQPSGFFLFLGVLLGFLDKQEK